MGGRFTIVELMIAVGIVATLAAVAIPRFMATKYASKRAEVLVNVPAIRVAMVAYVEATGDSAFALTTSITGTPRHFATVDGTSVAWPYANATWRNIGFSPSGKVYAAYVVHQKGAGDINWCDGAPNEYVSYAISDVDDDSWRFRYGCCMTQGPGMNFDDGMINGHCGAGIYGPGIATIPVEVIY